MLENYLTDDVVTRDAFSPFYDYGALPYGPACGNFSQSDLDWDAQDLGSSACLAGIPSKENCPPLRKKFSMFNNIKTRDENIEYRGSRLKSSSVNKINCKCVPPNDKQQSRRFFLHFDSKSADLTNDCLVSEKLRCKAFWDMVDSEPCLTQCIKEGEFVHSSTPQSQTSGISAKVRTTKKALQFSCNEEERARNEALHMEERRRLQKRRQHIDELQAKSGQSSKRLARTQQVENRPGQDTETVGPYNKTTTGTTKPTDKPLYADLCTDTTPDQAMDDMRKYDAKMAAAIRAECLAKKNNRGSKKSLINKGSKGSMPAENDDDDNQKEIILGGEEEKIIQSKQPSVHNGIASEHVSTRVSEAVVKSSSLHNNTTG